MKDETRLSHKDSQSDLHTQLSKAIFEGQLQELGVAGEGELDHEYNQVKDIEKHSDIVLTDFEGELKMLEDRLINPRIDKEYSIQLVDLV
jgi:hypothetical protein